MAAEKKRLFIAIPISEQWKNHLSKQCTLIQTKLSFQKWTHPNDYHITLKFLGDTSPTQLEQVSAILADVAKTSHSFELTDKRWGTFGAQAAPSILWAGVGGELDALVKLQSQIDSLDAIGFPHESRPFHPHLTIARRYNGNGPLTPALRACLPNAVDPSIHSPVNELILFQSHLHKKTMYEAVVRFQLNTCTLTSSVISRPSS